MIEGRELATLVEVYPILHALPAGLQHSFSDSCNPVRLKAGEVVFEADRPIQHLVFLTSGSIRVIYLGPEREISLYRVQPGEVCMLSICQLLAGMPYPVRAFTEQPVTGVAIPKLFLAQLFTGSPVFCAYLFQAISERLVNLLALLESITFGRLDQRLAGLLLSKEITFWATHSQLADELGTVREVVSRILKDFEHKGLVKLERRQIRILNRSALEVIAGVSANSIHFSAH